MVNGHSIVVDARSSRNPSRHHSFAATVERSDVPVPGRTGRLIHHRKGFVTLVLAGDLPEGPFASLRWLVGTLRESGYDRVRILRRPCPEATELFALAARPAAEA